MKAEKVMFVNPNGFKEYAVRYRKNAMSPWQFVTDSKGRNVLFSEKLADAAVETYRNG